jgi:hypothetical protein
MTERTQESGCLYSTVYVRTYVLKFVLAKNSTEFFIELGFLWTAIPPVNELGGNRGVKELTAAADSLEILAARKIVTDR